MKTRMNGKPQIQAPCPWRRFGRSSEKKRSGMLILFSILILSLSKDVLSRTNGQSVLLRLLVLEIWVSWHNKKDKGLSSYRRASNAFAWAPYWKKKRRHNVEPKLKRKKMYGRHHVTMQEWQRFERMSETLHRL